jgi:hypothetical protein
MGERQAALGEDQEVQLAEAGAPLAHQVQDRPHPGPLLGRIGDHVALLSAAQVVGNLGEKAVRVLPDGQAQVQGRLEDLQHLGSLYRGEGMWIPGQVPGRRRTAS